MSDIVERLQDRAIVARNEGTGTGLGDAIHFEEAASTITALEKRVEELDLLLRGFAALRLTNVNGGTDNALMQTDRLTAAPLVLSARAALEEK